MPANPFETDLDQNVANYAPLTPLSFLPRTAAVYPDHVAVIHGERRFTYAELYARCRRLASALVGRGLGPGDTVAVMAPNVPALLEAHYGVAMMGGVLNAINYRLDAATDSFILEHGEAKLLITAREFSEVIAEALSSRARRTTRRCSRRAPPISPGPDPTTSGARSRSTTPRAPPARPRAWSITTAAPT